MSFYDLKPDLAGPETVVFKAEFRLTGYSRKSSADLNFKLFFKFPSIKLIVPLVV